MKALFTLILGCFILCIYPFTVKADHIVLEQNFSDGSIPSGWETTGTVKATTSSSKTCISLAASSSITLPMADQIISVSFSHRASGSSKELKLEKSVNGGEWVQVDKVTPSSASAWGAGSMSVNEKGSKNVKLRFSCNSATIYITDIKVTASDIGDAPTQQAGISFGTVTGSSVIVQLSKGNGSGRLLVYKKDSAVDFVPVAGISYEAGSTLSNGNTVVESGDIEQITVKGLEAGETYYFSVFEYNGFEETANYLTPGATNSVRTLEVPSIILSTYKINFGRLKTGTDDKREFSVSGKYLNPASGSITVNSTADFQVSTDNISYASSVQISYSGSILSSAKLYIKFSPAELKDYTANIQVSGGGSETQILSLSGSGSDTDTKIYYLSPNGKDSNTGSYDSPWFTLGKAIEMVKPGDIVYVRGGEYKYPGMTFKIDVSKSGTADKRICVFAYEKEEPLFNFDQPTGTSEGDSKLRGIVHQGDYWYFYGIHLTKARDNAVKLEGNYNIYERCTFSYNGDTGLQLGFGHSFQDSHPGISKNDGSYCSNNFIIDCDSYRNYDWQTKGGNADGYACKMHNGKDNWFIRCRAWENSDDGWDLYETDYPVYLIECWAWRSAREGDHPANQGNGNGIKMGGNGTGGSSVGVHEAWNCVAFNCNKASSVKGFDQNSHGGGLKIVNCLAFGCGYDFMFEKSSSKTMEFYNNACLGKQEIVSGSIESNNALASAISKGWSTALTGIGFSDYSDLSEDAAKAPRGIDGSLPKGFARLKEGSKLIGAAKQGMVAPLPEIGIQLFGTALTPRVANNDIGPYDLKTATSSRQILIDPEAKLNISIYPNPAKDNTTIRYAVNRQAEVTICVYDMQGRKVIDIRPGIASEGIEYHIPVDTDYLSGGVYIVNLQSGSEQTQCKLIISK